MDSDNAGVNMILWDRSGEIIHKYNSVVHQSIMRMGHKYIIINPLYYQSYD